MTRQNHTLTFKTFLLLVVSGIIATFIMDIGAAGMRASGLTTGIPPDLIGKWIESAFVGNVFVDDIRTSPGEPVPIKKVMLYHYSIGITLAILFYLMLLLFKVRTISWWLPIVYGLATTIIPAFLMFPGMGFGLLGLKGPAEYRLLPSSIVNHLFYGIGLTLAVQLFFRQKFEK